MEPEVENIESAPVPKTQESQFSRWSSITLMVAILCVASILSALTAMRFAIRGREVAVPDLAGKTEAEAQDILNKSGLALKVSSKQFSAKVPEGHVLEQIPAKGTQLKTSRTVKVLLSLGNRRFAVPNLLGTSLRAAQLMLNQRRLTVGSRNAAIHGKVARAPAWRRVCVYGCPARFRASSSSDSLVLMHSDQRDGSRFLTRR